MKCNLKNYKNLSSSVSLTNPEEKRNMQLVTTRVNHYQNTAVARILESDTHRDDVACVAVHL